MTSKPALELLFRDRLLLSRCQNGEDTHYLDHPILSLNDFHWITGNLQTGPRFRNILKMFHNVTVKRFWPSKR